MKNYTITVNGKVYEVTVEEGFSSGKNSAPAAAQKTAEKPAMKTAPADGGTPVKAPMPGKILRVHAVSGQKVKRGDVLFVLEAMKMENEIVAPIDGVVGNVLVASGDSAESGDVLTFLN